MEESNTFEGDATNNFHWWGTLQNKKGQYTKSQMIQQPLLAI